MPAGQALARNEKRQLRQPLLFFARWFAPSYLPQGVILSAAKDLNRSLVR